MKSQPRILRHTHTLCTCAPGVLTSELTPCLPRTWGRSLGADRGPAGTSAPPWVAPGGGGWPRRDLNPASSLPQGGTHPLPLQPMGLAPDSPLNRAPGNLWGGRKDLSTSSSGSRGTPSAPDRPRSRAGVLGCWSLGGGDGVWGSLGQLLERPRWGNPGRTRPGLALAQGAVGRDTTGRGTPGERAQGRPGFGLRTGASLRGRWRFPLPPA